MNGVTVDGRYEVVKILGGGAFGQTFLSKDTKRPGHPYCVVKQLRYSHSNPQALQHARRLFKKEAEILEKLGHHDQIPTLLADIEEGQDFFLVEQFIPGHPLTQEMVPGLCWSEEQVLQFLKETLEILVFVHGQGVIHRDLKPANLMRRQPDDRLVLIDFGAVKELGTQIALGHNLPTIAIGTPGYMAIEQFNGQPQFNSDLYALGIIAIQALLGLAADEISTLKDSSSHPPGEVKWRDRRSVTPALADIIDRMVLLDYRQRYPTAAAVLTDLSHLSQSTTTPNESANPDALASTVLPRSPSVPTIAMTSPPAPPPDTLPQPALNSELPPAPATHSSPTVSTQPGTNRLLTIATVTLVALAGLAGIGVTQRGQVAEYFYNQGREKSRFGDTKAALDRYNLALQIHPTHANAFARRCGTYLRLEDDDRAQADCQRSLDLDPDNAIAHLNWGNFYSEQRNLEEANRYYTRAVELSSREIQLEPTNADAYYHRGAARFRLNDRPGAIEDATKAIELDPNYVEAYIARCQARGQMSQHQQAVEDCTQATEINPNSYTAFASLCNNLNNLGQYQAALDACTRALQINPNDSYGYNNRGIVWLRLGNHEAAVNDYRQAIQRDPKDAVAYHNLGDALSAQGDHQGAIEAYTQAVDNHPSFAAAFYGRGIRYAAVGNPDQAIADLQQSADLFLQQGRRDRAEDAQYQIRQIQDRAGQTATAEVEPSPDAPAEPPVAIDAASPADLPADVPVTTDTADGTDNSAAVITPDAPPPPALQPSPPVPDSYAEEPPTYNYELPPDPYVQEPPAPYAAPAPYPDDLSGQELPAEEAPAPEPSYDPDPFVQEAPVYRTIEPSVIDTPEGVPEGAPESFSGE